MPEKSIKEFKTPPVIEVVCGVAFQEINELLAAHLGLYWEIIKADYPKCKELPPLAPSIENYDFNSHAINMEFTDTPPLARTWFIHKEENGVIQIQRDRFLHNWKKTKGKPNYPRYTSVISIFKEQFGTFNRFLKEIGISAIAPMQLELSYINHIPFGNELNSLNDIGDVFPDFVHDNRKPRFLPEPEGINWRNSYLLPEKSGRLHATLRSAAKSDSKNKLIQLDLTARGFPSDASDIESLWNWFDLAHEWIVKSFVDMTSPAIRKNTWGEIT